MEKDYEKIYFELLEISNNLKQMVNTEYYPEEIEDNINAAIVYLDCAKENAGQLQMNKKARFCVRPQVVAFVPKSA